MKCGGVVVVDVAPCDVEFSDAKVALWPGAFFFCCILFVFFPCAQRAAAEGEGSDDG